MFLKVETLNLHKRKTDSTMEKHINYLITEKRMKTMPWQGFPNTSESYHLTAPVRLRKRHSLLPSTSTIKMLASTRMQARVKHISGQEREKPEGGFLREMGLPPASFPGPPSGSSLRVYLPGRGRGR